MSMPSILRKSTVGLLATFWVVCLATTLWAQPPAETATADASQKIPTRNLLNVISDGGPLMIPIGRS